MTSEQRTISFKEMVIQSTMSSATTTTTTTTITMTTVTTSSSLDHRINNREESGKKIFSNKEFGSKALTSDFDDNYSQRRSIRKDSIEIPPIPDNPQPPPSNHFLNHLHRYRNNDDDDDQDDDYNDDGDDNSDDEDDNGGNDGDLDENIATNDYDGEDHYSISIVFILINPILSFEDRKRNAQQQRYKCSAATSHRKVFN